MNESSATQCSEGGRPGAESLRAFGAALVSHAAHWLDERRYVERHRRYIDELDRAGELDGLLEWLGITREQLDAFAISPLASAELLQGVMARAGLADTAGEALTTDLAQRCRTCANWRACRRWLASNAQDEGYREFCPNAPLLDRLSRGAT